MHRTDGDGHVANQFVEGDPLIPTPPTAITAPWMNAVQEELAGVIEAAGLTLNKADNAQLRKALDARGGTFTLLSAADLHVGHTSGDGQVGIDGTVANEMRLQMGSGSTILFSGRFRAPAGATIASMWVRCRTVTGAGQSLALEVVRYDYNAGTGAKTATRISSPTSGGAAGAAAVTTLSSASPYTWIQVPLVASPGTIAAGAYVSFTNPTGWPNTNVTDFRLDFTFP